MPAVPSMPPDVKATASPVARLPETTVMWWITVHLGVQGRTHLTLDPIRPA